MKTIFRCDNLAPANSWVTMYDIYKYKITRANN